VCGGALRCVEVFGVCWDVLGCVRVLGKVFGGVLGCVEACLSMLECIGGICKHMESYEVPSVRVGAC